LSTIALLPAWWQPVRANLSTEAQTRDDRECANSGGIAGDVRSCPAAQAAYGQIE
jgi:hypothetical protein